MLLSNRTKSAIDLRSYDVVVVGAGVAGLAFSLALPEGWRVALLTKGVLGESNTRYAQGGISAAIGPDDSTRLHEDDTLVAGAGLCDPAAVRALVDGAPSAIDRLLAIGTKFDRSVPRGPPAGVADVRRHRSRADAVRQHHIGAHGDADRAGGVRRPRREHAQQRRNGERKQREEAVAHLAYG